MLKFLVFFFLCFFGFAQANAADNNVVYRFGDNSKPAANQNTKNIGDKKLTLVDVLDMALTNNPQVRQSWINVDISEYNYKMTKSEWLPELDISAGYNYGQSNYDNDVKTKTNNLNPALNLSYLLFDFGGREAEISSFKHKLESTKYDTNSFVQDFIYNVINAYYSLFSSMANAETARETERSSEEAFNAASTRHKIGLAPLTDKLQAENSYIQDKLVRERIEKEVKLKMATLNYLLDLDASTQLDLAMPKLDTSEDIVQKNIINLMEMALKNRPDLKSKYELKKAQEKSIYKAKSAWMPSVSLSGSVGLTDDHTSGSNGDRDYYSVGLKASMPIFTGGYIYNNVAKTKAELQSIEAQISDLEKNIEKDVWTAYHNFETARSIHKTSKTLLENATKTEKTVLGMYKNGRSSILDVLVAQTSLSEAKYEYNTSLYNYFINRADLIRSLGKISPEDLEALTNMVNL